MMTTSTTITSTSTRTRFTFLSFAIQEGYYMLKAETLQQFTMSV
jgi:hypothetical protein